ncbi:MAG TPA: phage holin family protein [Rubricoccaceae bacterium]|nr:phage holin family protein [Rubricoccaceae bacterium]
MDGDGLPASRSPYGPNAVVPAPPERRLPAHRNKVARISDHLAGVSEDLREWVELRIALAKAEVTEQAKLYAGQAAAGVVALLALLFGLVALAHGLGAWLGHPGWGFLAVTVLLVLVACSVYGYLVVLPQRRTARSHDQR